MRGWNFLLIGGSLSHFLSYRDTKIFSINNSIFFFGDCEKKEDQANHQRVKHLDSSLPGAETKSQNTRMQHFIGPFRK